MQNKILDLSIPYPRMDNLAAAGAAIARARELLDQMSLIHCLLRATEVVATEPRCLGLSFDGEWNSNDEGGSYFYLTSKLRMESIDGDEAPGSGEFEWLSQDETDCSAGERVGGILSQWEEELANNSFEFYSPQDFLTQLGQHLMGEEEFNVWKANQEADEIDEATGAATAPSTSAKAL